MTEAFALLDEAMLPVLAGQVPLDWAGDIYCVVLNQCHHLADLPRMRAWTQSMERWCADFAASDTYGGVCDVHRLQLLAATDDYRQLEARLVATSQALEDVNSWAAGEGYYQLGEVLRLRGDVDGAFAAFAGPVPSASIRSRARRCCAAGRVTVRPRGPTCGSRWRVRTGWAGCGCCAAPSRWRWRATPSTRPNSTAANWKTAQRLSAHRLSGLGGARARRDPGAPGAARRCPRGAAVGAARVPDPEVAVRDRPGLRVDGARASGARRRRRGRRRCRHRAEHLRPTRRRTRQVCGPLAGRPDQTGAGDPDRDRRGATNRQVAQQIFISEKTVARHLANIYAKLGVSSRTAAVAWAHQNNALT